MTTYLGKSCSFGLPRVPFVNCRRFMYLVISLLVYRAGCGIWLYQFLIIAYLFTLWPSSIKYTIIWSPLTRIGTCLRLVEGTGVSQIPALSVSPSECINGWTEIFPFRGDNCNLELIFKCRSQHVVFVETSSLFHHNIYLWFICFPWWSIDELENLHADQTTIRFEPWLKLRARLGSRKTSLSTHHSILILTVPRRYFCCGFLL